MNSSLSPTRFTVALPKGMADWLKDKAKSRGISLNAQIITMFEKEMTAEAVTAIPSSAVDAYYERKAP